MRILFITANRLGDAILSTGLLNHLAEQHPAARFTVACGPIPAPLFAAMPFVERVIPIPKRAASGHWFRLWAQTVLTPWSRVVDLRGSALAWCLPAGRRDILTRDRGPESQPVVRRFGQFLKVDPPPAPRLWVTDFDNRLAEALIPSGSQVLAIGPTASWLGKQWPAERFARLALSLTAEDGPLPHARIAILTAASERAMAEPLLDRIPPQRQIDLTTGHPLPILCACLRRASLYIGNDSGLMHMAAAMGIPTLGLFGPSREDIYAPWGDHTASVRGPRSYDQIVSDPAYDFRLPVSYMDDLSVDSVAAAAQALWTRVQAESSDSSSKMRDSSSASGSAGMR